MHVTLWGPFSVSLFCKQKEESRLGLLVAEAGAGLTRKEGAVGKERTPGCSTSVLLAHDVVCRAHGVVFVDELQTLHVLPENVCLCESRLPVTCLPLPTAFSGTFKTWCLLKWT